MIRRREEIHGREDQQSRVINELSTLVLNLIRSPPMPYVDQSPVPMRRSHPRMASSTTISPSSFAWLMLGISVSMMLCGSVTFFIGFMLLPWVIGLIMVLYVAGIVSLISMLGRSILFNVIAPSPRKDIPGNIMEALVKRKGGSSEELDRHGESSSIRGFCKWCCLLLHTKKTKLPGFFEY